MAFKRLQNFGVCHYMSQEENCVVNGPRCAQHLCAKHCAAEHGLWLGHIMATGELTPATSAALAAQSSAASGEKRFWWWGPKSAPAQTPSSETVPETPEPAVPPVLGEVSELSAGGDVFVPVADHGRAYLAKTQFPVQYTTR